MKYTVTLLDTSTGRDEPELRVTKAITVDKGQPAEEAALDYAIERSRADQVPYLVVNIERGD